MKNLLAGVRIIDLTRALAGPTCTALLSDLGAEVVKVEGLPGGDGARRWGPFREDRSQYFASINRNKRSLALNLRTPEGRSVLEQLLTTADVLIENFRPGVLASMGLAPERLRSDYPRLVLASISGYGPVGPERASAGLDQIAQGMSGLMSVTGAGDQTPMRVGVPIVDSVTGIVAATAVAAAIAGRERTGVGTHVQTSLLESAIALLSFQAQRYVALGEVPTPQGNNHPVIAPYGAFRTATDPINIAASSDKHWRALCDVVGGAHLAAQSEYRDGRSRLEHRDALQRDLEDRLALHPAEHWITRIRAAGIPCGPIHHIDQVFADPQVQALEMIHQVTTTGDRPVSLVRGPIWVENSPTPVRSAPPDFGEHSEEILLELGLSAVEIDDLRDAGVTTGPALSRTGVAR